MSFRAEDLFSTGTATTGTRPNPAIGALTSALLATGLMWGATGVVMPSGSRIADTSWTTMSIPARQVPDSAETVRRLKDYSGLSWDQLAALFGVTRRAVHFWVNGGNLSAPNLVRLRRVAQVIDGLDAESPRERRAALIGAGAGEQSPFELLAAEIEVGLRSDRRDRAVDLLDARQGGPHTPGEVVGTRSLDLPLAAF